MVIPFQNELHNLLSSDAARAALLGKFTTGVTIALSVASRAGSLAYDAVTSIPLACRLVCRGLSYFAFESPLTTALLALAFAQSGNFIAFLVMLMTHRRVGELGKISEGQTAANVKFGGGGPPTSPLFGCLRCLEGILAITIMLGIACDLLNSALTAEHAFLVLLS